jgi:hypothetical protein
LRALEQLKLLRRHPQRDRGGHVSVSIYELLPSPEFTGCTALSVQVENKEAGREQARAALAQRRDRVLAELAAKRRDSARWTGRQGSFELGT